MTANTKRKPVNVTDDGREGGVQPGAPKWEVVLATLNQTKTEEAAPETPRPRS